MSGNKLSINHRNFKKQMLNYIEQKVEQIARERDEYKRQLEKCQSRSNAKNSMYNTQVIEQSFADPALNAKWYSKGGKTRRRKNKNKNKNKSRRNRK